MSTAEASVAHKRYLTPAMKAAIIASVASGRTQAQVAKDFEVHPNTVYNACKHVRQLSHAANPLSKDWAAGAREDARVAVTKGMRCKLDPYKAANIGLKVLTGLGDLIPDSVESQRTFVISWGEESTANTQDSAPVIDVTPRENTPVSE